ncbi:DUF5906 domain-containing protein [Novilysobacter arseniciresistens]|uniref:DUF5906 domain-containing protein n=1 Tax=Novilysobacter arseniciresistens TaxID=1385522 RepID=UPI000A928C64|nr:DUF5906 domain-containing protein [Lysobacter arseniciresistens]
MGYAPSLLNEEAGSVKSSGNVTPFDKAHRKRRGNPSGEQQSEGPPPISAAKLYADAMMKEGGWAASNPSAGSTVAGSSGVMIYNWNGLHWKHIGGEDGDAHAALWLDTNMPDKATPHKAKGLWQWLSMRLRDAHKLPNPSRQDMAIVPCGDAYLEITKDGIRSIAPDPLLGLTYATKIQCGTPHGKVHNPIPFNPKSKFGAWLCHALPDEGVRLMVQEQCGVCLLPGVYSQAAWWWGVAGSGKSTLAGMVEMVLSSVAGVRLESLGDQFGLEPIVGAQLIRVEEVEIGEKWDEGRFKPLVSGDGVYVNRKMEKAIGSYKSTGKWIITSNPEPYIRDKSDGVLRRLGIVHWAHKIQGDQDPLFAEKIMETEGRMFLDWLIEGALRVIRRGRMMSEKELPGAAREYRESVRRNSDSVRDWVMEESVRFVPGKWKPTSEILARFTKWSEENFKRPLGENGATILVRSLGQIPGVNLGKRSNRRIKGGQAWGYELDWTPMLAEDDPRALLATHPHPVHKDADYGAMFED